MNADMILRMERATKKTPPPMLPVQVFLNSKVRTAPRVSLSVAADRIIQSLLPPPGKGRIFIGVRTSQTTGLAAHVAAPFFPTVEREAMDLQDATLKTYNTQLLELCGMVMRYALENIMFTVVDRDWKINTPMRHALEAQKQQRAKSGGSESSAGDVTGYPESVALSDEETQVVLLLQAFCPDQSTPDTTVGQLLLESFVSCVTGVPPVLTKSGVMRGDRDRLPHRGIESFVEVDVVRRSIYREAVGYHDKVARVRTLQLSQLIQAFRSRALEQEEFVSVLKWWPEYARQDAAGARKDGLVVKQAIRFVPSSRLKCRPECQAVPLKDIIHFVQKGSILALSKLPLPASVIDPTLADTIGHTVLADSSMIPWFSPLTVDVWACFVADHPIMCKANPNDENRRICALALLSKEYSVRSGSDREAFGNVLVRLFGSKKCIPIDRAANMKSASAAIPSELYLTSADLGPFTAFGSFPKVSSKLRPAGVTETFLKVSGVRKSIAIPLLLTSLPSLGWTDDPKELVEYLRAVTLTSGDMRRLQQAKYLPAESRKSETFAPSELYLPGSFVSSHSSVSYNGRRQKCFLTIPTMVRSW